MHKRPIVPKVEVEEAVYQIVKNVEVNTEACCLLKSAGLPKKYITDLTIALITEFVPKQKQNLVLVKEGVVVGRYVAWQHRIELNIPRLRRYENQTKDEYSETLLHELGHVVDIYHNWRHAINWPSWLMRILGVVTLASMLFGVVGAPVLLIWASHIHGIFWSILAEVGYGFVFLMLFGIGLQIPAQLRHNKMERAAETFVQKHKHKKLKLVRVDNFA